MILALVIQAGAILYLNSLLNKNTRLAARCLLSLSYTAKIALEEFKAGKLDGEAYVALEATKVPEEYRRQYNNVAAALTTARGRDPYGH